ncbi:Protocadherin gamma-A3 [Echinococcus granulosus]|uniref:Protocadherin gamma-A3 n=2 Tax=Echinococcus granulosus TaxID=6210 RepID=W6V190_ECHGR|nr:Protocadherin gamma-A3 [Echinococcus granulosus]EUB64682.1 Protocadherin gamma-A3 [Echinococcus granulosus]
MTTTENTCSNGDANLGIHYAAPRPGMRSSKFTSNIHSLPLPLHTTIILLLLVPLSKGFIARFEINEGVPVESHVGSLASHSHSPSGSLIYNKVPNLKDASRYFNVDKFSGRISVALDLDREVICPLPTHKPDDECILRFSVTCLRIVGRSVEAIADVVVTLRDVNDNGCYFVPSTEQTILIRENADVDKTRVQLNSPLDPDSAGLGHSIQWNQVRLEDPSATFHLHVVYSRTGGNLRSSHPVGYRQQDAQLFLGLLRPLDYESSKQHYLTIVAGDGLHECKLTVRIEVEDADDNLPIFEKAVYNVSVAENLPFNEKIVTVKAHDADAGEFGRVFYSIDPYLTDPSNLEMFHVDQESGAIFRKSKPRYQDSLHYQLTIKASNNAQSSAIPPATYIGGQSSFLTKVFITLEDVNDHEPIITIFSPTGSKKLTLTENLPGGRDVAILSVEDKDTGVNAVVECHLKSQSIRGALLLRPMTSETESFDHSAKVATSRKYKLLTTRSFDREQHPEIHFTIECWDGGKPVMRSIQKETIHIIDVNDCAPIFGNKTHHFRVYEDPSPGTAGVIRNSIQPEQIGQIRARDDDTEQNAKLQYQFSSECPQSFLDLVKLDKDTGTLHSTGGLDREKLAFISCKVIASDMGSPPLSSQTEVAIEILDMNDNAPQFEHHEYNFQVEENLQSGTLIGIIRVFDVDLGINSKLEFSLEGMQATPWSKEDNMESLFSSVNPKREKLSSQHLSLLRFEAIPVRTHLPGGHYGRNSSRGEEDGGTYEVRLYTAAPIDRESLVSLPAIDGSVSSMNGSAETVVLRFMLRAQDSGNPRLVSRVPINLRISDVNDNAPVFILPPADSVNATEVRLSIREPIGFQFTKIFASDPDAAENASLIYRIRAGDPFDLFKLDPRSGELSVAKDCSSSGQYMGQYLLFLEAADRGSPRRFSEAQLLIHMDDSEPLGRVERDIFGFPIRSSVRGGSSVGGAGSRSMNLYIITAIIIASFIISSVLLVAICLVVRRARTTEQNGRGVGRYCGGGRDGGGGLHNGSIFRDTNIGNGYLKSVPLSLPQTKYTTCDPLDEDLSEANFSYLTPQPSNGGYVYEGTMGFQPAPFCSPGATTTATILAEVSPAAATATASPHAQLLAATATTGPDGIIRLSCLPPKQAHTLGRCTFLGQKKLTEDRVKGKRNSLTDRDSGNGDSLDVGSCLLNFPSSLEAPRSTTPCFQHLQNQHLHQYQFQPLPPTLAFAASTELQKHQHQQYITASSPKEVVEAVDASGNLLTSTFV